MRDYTQTKKEIEQLIENGDKLYEALSRADDNPNKCKDLRKFLREYEMWYTHALSLVRQLTPDRVQDFIVLYSDPKRKQLEVDTYCISDALRTISHRNNFYGPWTASLCVYRQIAMLKACLETFDSRIFNLQTILQADIFDSEIESARHLFKRGFLRAAGAICGVVIEKHLLEVCESHNISIKKKTPTIADFNDLLKDQVYDVVEWRRIQRLGDIRNLCDHNKDREPTKDEVEELISGTERVIKNIF